MKIFLVDDHVLFREGLAAILRAQADIDIVGQAGSVQETVKLALQLEPEIILMDYYLPDGTGVDATLAILKERPDCKIVFLTISDCDDNLFKAIRSGAKGYLLKNLRPATLIDSIRSIYRGEGALSPAMTLRVMEELAKTAEPECAEDKRLEILTERELDVLDHLVNGKSNLEIAQELFLSENTVKHHIHSIFQKLDLPNRRAAALYAQAHKLFKRGSIFNKKVVASI